jgi:uncharacterized protein
MNHATLSVFPRPQKLKIRHVFFVVFCLSFFGCANKKPIRVIDAHMHSEFTGEHEPTSQIEYSRQSMEKEMAENNVKYGVSIMSEFGKGEYEKVPKNMIQCVGVQEVPDLKKIESGLGGMRYRCIKIYLGYVHRYANDPAYKPVYALAQRYGVPVIFHAGDTYDAYRPQKAKLKYADPLTIDEIAVDHPKINFIIAHMGNPWIHTSAEVAYKNKNVYLDVSGLLVGDLSALDSEIVNEYVTKPIKWAFHYIENPEKILFGTDWSLVRIGPYVEAVQKAIPEKYWDNVFYMNAAKLFGFPTNPLPETQR